MSKDEKYLWGIAACIVILFLLLVIPNIHIESREERKARLHLTEPEMIALEQKEQLQAMQAQLQTTQSLLIMQMSMNAGR